MTRFLSRKFLVSLLAIISADGLVLAGSINGAVWGSTVGSVIALYAVANVAQKIGTKTGGQ